MLSGFDRTTTAPRFRTRTIPRVWGELAAWLHEHFHLNFHNTNQRHPLCHFVPLFVPLPRHESLHRAGTLKPHLTQSQMLFCAITSSLKQAVETDFLGILSPVRLPFRHTGIINFLGIF